MRNKKVIPVEPTVRVLETFRKISSYNLLNLMQDKPDCFNGIVSVRKYRITVELIDEPIDVIQARIRELYIKSDNHHQWQPLQEEAKKYGMERLER